MPSLRMSMSICSLWGVVSFSICGATYPLFSMDSPIQAIGQLFPMRHYYMIYQINIYNDPLGYVDLILNGDPEEYLKNVTGSHGLED